MLIAPRPCSSSVRSTRLRLALLSAIVALPALPAASLIWDPANVANGSTIDPGSGTWDTTAGNTVWNNAGVNAAWTQTNATTALNSAQFAGADAPVGSPYTVTLATSVAVASGNNALWFANSGYTLTAATTTRTITTPQVTVSTDKTATISGTVTVTTGTTALSLGGFGTLTVKDGARLSPNNNIAAILHGAKVIAETGGIITGTQLVVGSGTANATPTQLTVTGGNVTVGSTGTTASTASNIVVCNINSGTATATLKIVSGTVQNLSTGRSGTTESGLRFGTTAAGGTVAGTVDLDGGTLVLARVYENSASTINSTFNFNGGVLKVQTGAGNAANFLTGLDNAFVKEGGAFIDTNGVATTIAQPLLHGGVAATDGGLVKQGSGTLTLTGANTYTGATTVNAGTLAISAPYSGLTATTVNSGARLQIASGTSASTLPGLTLNSGGGVELNLGVYDLTRLASASVTSFNAAGDYAIHLSGTNIPVGDYTIFTYSGKTGSGVPSVGSMPAGVTATVQDNGSAVILSVLTPQVFNYVWSAGTGSWDTSTANWTGLTYTEGSVATFPDLAGNNTVTLSAARSPYSVAIQNNIGNTYTLAGAGIAGSASVSKSGTGAATLSVANTYTGATTVSEGALVVAADGALGSADGSTTLAPNTSIALSGGVNYATAEKIVGSGPGPLVANVGPLLALQRGLVQGVSGSNTFAGPIEINASGFTRFGVQDGASLTLTGPITTATGVTGVNVLFRVGTNGDFITLTSPNNRWDGITTLFSSTTTGTTGLRLGVDNGLPVVSTITGGGTSGNPLMTFDLAGHQQTLNGLTGSNGYVNIVNSSALPSVLTLDLLTADVSQARTDTLPNLTLIQDGTGSGKVAVVKKGAFKQILAGVHTYTGPTTLEAGALAFTGTGALGATPVTMLAGSTLDVAGVTASDFALSAGLAGSGTLTATGKTVTVSTAFAPGALAVTGNLTLASGTAATVVAGATPEASSAVTVSGALVLNGTLAVTKASGFSFATGQTFVFATAAGGITTGLTGVTVDGQALVETSPDVWTATIGGLDYSFAESTATLTVSGGVVISPLQAWRNTYFPGAGNDGTGIGANDADPDGDGISNLLEYATGTIPTAANAPAVTSGTADGRLTLSFPRVNDPALVYTVQGRNDLATGSWVAVTAANNPSSGGVTPVTVQDEVAISAQPRRFLRLEVKLAP